MYESGSGPEPCPCGDINRSGGPVDLTDFATFGSCFGLPAPTEDCPAPALECSDLNGDGAVNLLDFATFANWMGESPAGFVPECE